MDFFILKQVAIYKTSKINKKHSDEAEYVLIAKNPNIKPTKRKGQGSSFVIPRLAVLKKFI